MNLETLTKIYYKDLGNYEKAYEERFYSPFAQHLGIAIKQYNRQRAYPAFFYYTNEMAVLNERIYKAYEKFLYIVNSVPPVVRHQFALLSIVDEVKSTNDIEGVHSTRKEIRDILDGKTSHSERFMSIVTKYNELLSDKKISFMTCQDIRDFYDTFAHQEIVSENPEHQLDGKIFRKDPVSVESGDGKIIHQGLFPEEEIIKAMEQALRLLHTPEYPLLIRLGLFHYFFAYIHPFYDGNGRTVRFITSYFLSEGFHRLLALRLSIFIKGNRSRYYKMFSEADSEINRGDLAPFLTGFLRIVLGTTEDTIRLLSRKRDQLKKYEKRIDDINGSDPYYIKDELLQNVYFVLLQAALFYGKGVSMADLMDMTSKNRATIQKRLDAIPRSRLLVTRAHKTNFYKLNLLMFKE